MRNSVADIRHQFISKARVERLERARRLKRQDAMLPKNEEDWNGDGARQRAIVRVRRLKNLEGADVGLQPRIDDDFQEFAGTIGVSKPRLRQSFIPTCANPFAMPL